MNIATILSSDAWSVLKGGIIGSPLSNPMLPRSWRWDASLVAFHRAPAPWELTPLHVLDPLLELILGDTWADSTSPLEAMTAEEFSLHFPSANDVLGKLGICIHGEDPAIPLGQTLALAGYDVAQVLVDLEHWLALNEEND